MEQQLQHQPACSRRWLKQAVVGLGAALAMIAGVYHSCRPQVDLPPVLLQVGPWSLTDHNGQQFGSKQLDGKVWVANFFFTRCPTVCPELIKKMAQLRQGLAKQADAISFVSFSVDPEHDTPQVLQQYRSQKQLDELPGGSWTFVTGDKRQLHELVVGQMKLHVGEKEPLQDGSERFDIGHITHVVLFDQKGNLRGLFDISPAGLQTLQHKARALIRHNAKNP